MSHLRAHIGHKDEWAPQQWMGDFEVFKRSLMSHCIQGAGLDCDAHKDRHVAGGRWAHYHPLECVFEVHGAVRWTPLLTQPRIMRFSSGNTYYLDGSLTDFEGNAVPYNFHNYEAVFDDVVTYYVQQQAAVMSGREGGH